MYCLQELLSTFNSYVISLQSKVHPCNKNILCFALGQKSKQFQTREIDSFVQRSSYTWLVKRDDGPLDQVRSLLAGFLSCVFHNDSRCYIKAVG